MRQRSDIIGANSRQFNGGIIRCGSHEMGGRGGWKQRGKKHARRDGAGSTTCCALNFVTDVIFFFPHLLDDDVCDLCRFFRVLILWCALCFFVFPPPSIPLFCCSLHHVACLHYSRWGGLNLRGCVTGTEHLGNIGVPNRIRGCMPSATLMVPIFFSLREAEGSKLCVAYRSLYICKH